MAHFALGAGTFAQGYDQTALGFVLASSYGGHVTLNAWQQGVVVASFFAGGIVGAFFSAGLNELSGRRTPLQAAAALALLGGALGATTTSYAWLLCVRTLFGVAMGMNNASLGIYLAARPARRSPPSRARRCADARTRRRRRRSR